MAPPAQWNCVFPALRIRQGAGQDVYSFAVDGKKLRSFATVAVQSAPRTRNSPDTSAPRPSPIRRDPQILESDAPIMPNSIVVAIDERVSSNH